MNTIVKENISQQLNGAEILVNALMNNGVNTVFGYPGAPILGLYEALSKTTEIKHILNRHEQASLHSAEGYARVSGKCGVVITTSGPGFTNTITGLMNANTDGTPIVVICAQTENIDKNEFQSVDVHTIAKACTKKVFSITKPDEIEKTISQAITDAMRLPSGAIVVSVTKSVLNSVSEQKAYRQRHEIKVEAPHSCVLRAIDSLKNAKRPLIIVGGGCAGSENEIREFVTLTGLPVVNTLMGKGIIDDSTLGLIGSNGNEKLNDIINKSDVVLALGVRFTERTTNYKQNFLKNSKIISINLHSNKSSNVRIDKEIIGEMQVVLQQIIGVIKVKNILFDLKYDWLETINSAVDEHIKDTYSVEAVLNKINNYTKKYNPIITTDVGEHQILASKIFKTTYAKYFLTAGGYGTMGYGLPASIGAIIAKPNALVMNITGDGSFQMNMQELGTCAQYELPIKIIIINNSALGMIKSGQKEKHYAEYQSDLLNPDFVKIANSYGIIGFNVSSMTDLDTALLQMFKYKKPVLLNIKV